MCIVREATLRNICICENSIKHLAYNQYDVYTNFYKMKHYPKSGVGKLQPAARFNAARKNLQQSQKVKIFLLKSKSSDQKHYPY